MGERVPCGLFERDGTTVVYESLGPVVPYVPAQDCADAVLFSFVHPVPAVSRGVEEFEGSAEQPSRWFEVALRGEWPGEGDRTPGDPQSRPVPHSLVECLAGKIQRVDRAAFEHVNVGQIHQGDYR
jgi:hypothetical protein